MRLLGRPGKPLPALILCFCIAGFLAESDARADPVVIVSPQDGAELPTQFLVKVTYGDVEYCDTETCADVPANVVDLLVDGEITDECDPCLTGEVDFDVTLAPGSYELEARASYASAAVYSGPVKITVEDESTSEASDSSASDASTISGGESDSAAGTSSDSEPIEKEGCTCEMTRMSGATLGWLALACLARRRRQRPSPHLQMARTCPSSRLLPSSDT
jgi:hypothetical protein